MQKEERSNSFTKSIMSLVVSLFCIGGVLGAMLVITSAIVDIQNPSRGYIDPQMFIAFAAYLGTPTATAIGFYAWKSKAENLLKIQQSHEKQEVSSVVQTISQIGG